MRQGRPRHPDILTPREWQVFDLIAEGLTNEEIAHRLGISIHGARYHVAEILSKLGVSSRDEAVRALRNHKRALGLWPPLEWFRAKLPAAGKLPALLATTAGIATVAVVLVAAFMLSGVWSLGSRLDSPATLERTAPGLDVLMEDSDVGAFLSRAIEVSRAVRARYRDAELKTVDLSAAGDWLQFRFLTTTASCRKEFAPATDPEIRAFYADKCDIFVFAPPGTASDQWQWQEHDAWQGDMNAPPLDLTAVLIGPDAVNQAAVAQWPDCTPNSLTLAHSRGQVTWTVSCSQPDGGILSGTVDARTGDFQPILDQPLYGPSTAPASR